jgi:hypothetical protein
MTHPAEQPALDNQHRRFDLGLVAGPAWSCRQDRGVVMGGHVGVSTIDLRLVETGLDDRDLGIVRHQQLRHAADRLECSGVGSDPVGERLGPARLRIGEVGGAQHGDKNLCRPGLAGQPVDDHRHRIAGVIDKQLVTASMGLPHRHRDPRCPAAVELARRRLRWPLDDNYDGRWGSLRPT